MNTKVFLILISALLASFNVLLGHNGHDDSSHFPALYYWIGRFHPIFLNFPIALLLTAGINELLFYKTSRPLYDQAARVMVITAAIFSIPTVLTGLAWSYGVNYEEFEGIFDWHRFFGFATAFLAIAAAYLREYTLHKKVYYAILFLACVSVILTGYFGGIMVFGEQRFIPPIIY